MKKIKFKANEMVATYSFHKDILKNNTLYELCKIFELSNLYIDIYSVDNRKNDLCELLRQKCENILLVASGTQRCQDIHIKATIDEITNISETLKEFYFEDMNIWNCYTEWEQYLKDKNIYRVPIFKKTEIKINSLFYLNYKENQVEIICEPSYDYNNLKEKLNKLL